MAQVLVLGIGFLLFVLLFFHSIDAQAKTITVDDDGEADYNTIEEAVQNSNNGDTIVIKPGSYGDITNVPKNISILGEDNVTLNTIDISSSNFTLQSIEIEGGEVVNSIDIKLLNVTIKQKIQIRDSKQLTMYKSRFTNLGPVNGLIIEGTENFSIQHTIFIQMGNVEYQGSQFQIYSSKNITINDNVINNSFYGIEIASGLNINIFTNQFTNLDSGLIIRECIHCQVYRNAFSNTRIGVKYYFKPLSIHDNSFYNVNHDVIYRGDSQTGSNGSFLSIPFFIMIISLLISTKIREINR